MGVPPWSHSELPVAARSSCSCVSSMVTAPAIVLAGGGPVGIEERSLGACDDVRVVGIRDDRERAPRTRHSARFVALAEREAPVGQRSAVRLVGGLDRRVDRLARCVGSVLAQVLQALLDVVARPVGRDVGVRRALARRDRDLVSRRPGLCPRARGQNRQQRPEHSEQQRKASHRNGILPARRAARAPTSPRAVHAAVSSAAAGAEPRGASPQAERVDEGLERRHECASGSRVGPLGPVAWAPDPVRACLSSAWMAWAPTVEHACAPLPAERRRARPAA